MKTRKEKISIAVLAGGKSSRMGSNKALLTIDGLTIIEHTLQTARHFSADCFVITNSPDKFVFLNTPLYPDSIKSIGPLAGIFTALSHAQHSKCLVLACDLPFLGKKSLQILTEDVGEEEMLAFKTSQRIEPICAVYSKKAIVKVKEAIDVQDYSAQNLANRLDARTLNWHDLSNEFDENALFNMNAPEDFEHAKTIIDSRKQKQK